MPPARLDLVLGAVIPFLRNDPRPDAELLTRFLDHRDEAAFEALVLRHAPAVRVACRGWLRSAADVDDAAQATFLVLVQRAGSIRNRASLGPWLYLGKLGGMAAGGSGGGNEAFAALVGFQALGTAVEGTYYPPDAKEKPAPSKRPLFMRPRNGSGEKPSK